MDSLCGVYPRLKEGCFVRSYDGFEILLVTIDLDLVWFGFDADRTINFLQTVQLFSYMYL